MSGICIRDFRVADTDGVLALIAALQGHERALYDRMKPADEVTYTYLDHVKSEAEEHGGALIVAEIGGQILGYATLLAQVACEDIDEIPNSYAYIGDLIVAETSRGQGIGQALLLECENRARKAEQRWLRLSVLAANGNARAAYRAMGFREHLLTLEKSL